MAEGFSVGDVVAVERGPFIGSYGVVTEVDSARAQLRLEISSKQGSYDIYADYDEVD
ncbi:KOW domain-containing RNA-binding protein [Nocardia stercoris]|uniref:hypothetical protein n=1 Tax=Nocardia stercoris TaxID=2483361 RepID=UPI00131A2242|nr:hypothetical protein [Nocardia stercoris]